MKTIKVNITKDPKFGYSNLSFSEKPTEEMLQELKNNGWYYTKHFNRWYTDTEEAWFSNWEYDDAYWNKDKSDRARKTYENSPHRFVDKWDTPILCIHGELDYRINANQGFGAFNAARLKGIPAQLLIYPDENHWVLKPQNGILWQRTFFNWLDKYLK